LELAFPSFYGTLRQRKVNPPSGFLVDRVVSPAGTKYNQWNRRQVVVSLQ